MNLALLVLRVVVGALFAGHGAQKLFGWFGGHGPHGTGKFFESAGVARGRSMALLAVLFAVTAAGPGAWSLDGRWDLDLAGDGWALLQLAAGILGAGLALGLQRVTSRRPHGHDRTAPARS